MLFSTPGWSLRLWPHDKSNHMTNPQMALLLIPCVRQNGQYRSPLGVIPVETTVATTVKFRPLFANLKQFSQTWPSAYGLEYMCVCIHTTCRPADTNHKSVYLRIYTSTYTRTVEVGWRGWQTMTESNRSVPGLRIPFVMCNFTITTRPDLRY